uniref:UDP-glycosyltransferase n=1 Tax=Punica granatum TaxID=22663 RepID=A0A8E8LD58_PUNGR|nr:UDP-glycosyltransferase [Punica granatum]
MMSLLPEKHIAVLPFIGASHFQPLVNLVLKLAAAAPRVLFSLLIATGDKHLLSCSDLPVNVKLYEAISSPWLSPPPGESRKEKMQQFLEGAPRTYEMAIAVAEETAGVKVSCLLTDVFFTFASTLAEKKQVKWIALWVSSPQVLSAYAYSDVIIQKFRHDEEARSQPERTLEGIPGLSRMRIKDLPEALQHTYLDDMYTLFPVFRELGTVLPRADAILVISYDEVTPEPLVANLKSKFQELLVVHLPPGFEERTRSHGKIVLWAPQNRVLWHRSVGAHVTHGGYNSVFECVAGEVPMICRPLWGDNKINGVVLEEWGIAVTIDGGTITKDGMLQCLEMVMEGGEVGKTMRQKIRDLKVLVMDAAGPNGSASRYFNKLVDIISS